MNYPRFLELIGFDAHTLDYLKYAKRLSVYVRYKPNRRNTRMSTKCELPIFLVGNQLENQASILFHRLQFGINHILAVTLQIVEKNKERMWLR